MVNKKIPKAHESKFVYIISENFSNINIMFIGVKIE